MAVTIKKTDSMSQIQTKLDKRGSIIFQAGTYKITKQLVISKGTVLDLNGAVLQRKASIQSVFLNKVAKSNTGYSADGNIIIKNGTIEGMGGYSYDNLMTFFHSHDIEISNMVFKDTLCHAIEFNGCSDVTVRNCRFLGRNLKSTDDAFRELIQLDHSGAGAFFLSGSTKSSPCYDKTPCANVTITDCYFGKSEYRDYPYACIGNHTQMYQGIQHSNIKIIGNEFRCKHSPLLQPCLSFISMRDVIVRDNKFDCDKIARIYSKPESWKTNGTKVNPYTRDGVCTNITITDNVTNCSYDDAFKQFASTNKKHTGIVKKPNTFNAKMM